MEIKIPSLGESVTEALIAEWLVKEGEVVKKDQNLVSIDSEKATVEIPAPSAGKLIKILKPAGETASTGDVIAEFEAEGATASESEPAKPQAAAKKETPDKPKAEATPKAEEAPKAEAPAESKAVAAKASPPPAKTQEAKSEEPASEPAETETAKEAAPAEEAPKKEDKKPEAKPAPRAAKPVIINSGAAAQGPASREDEIKPLSQLRRTVAKRLVEAQHTMAILTTFNEIDMTHVMALRKQYQESFQARHGVKIGFMSFFVKAVVDALKEVPQLNGEIRGNDIVLHKYIDIGVAIGAGKGLVVPPLRNAERLSFAEIEKNIADLATRAQANKLKPEELEGGTFTISNGGVYGSLLSTPIINPPQSGILGLHSIQERPVVRDGQIVIRSMMYAALSYDHRLVDGREAVTFLRRVKDIVEDPMRLLLEA